MPINNNENFKLINFSGGRSSAMMLYRMLPLEDNTIVCFANTGKEKEETLKFVDDCSRNWKVPITWIEYCPINKFKVVDYKTASRAGEPFEAMLNKKSYLPNVVKRFCTSELKIRPLKNYLKSIEITHYDSHIGIRYDEPRRYYKLMAQNDTNKNTWTNYCPLFKDKITIDDVNVFWKKQKFDLEIHSSAGNCDLCFLKGKSKLIRLIRNNPSSAKWWIELENKNEATFKKGISYSELSYIAINQMDIFQDEPDVQCFCNVD